jgi:AcrR family transcriptional regulator
VARVALGLFERRGFDRVTMDEIAEAASVSRRTLFRLFPSKSDLAWDGLESLRDALRLRAATVAGAGVRLGTLFDELFVPVLSALDEPESAALARRRLRLIGSNPALLNHKTLREIEDVIATAVAASAEPGGAPPALVARALVAATFAALLWWQEHGEGTSALSATRAAMKAVALGNGG